MEERCVMKDKLKNILLNRLIYLIYSLLFGILVFLIYYIFIKTGKSFIWEDDGLKQHFAILYDFNLNMRNIFRDGFSFFLWNAGLGLDVIGQYSYYILGDPFAYLSLLFPMDKLEVAYNVLVIARMYFIGIAFLVYCRFNKKDNFVSMLGCMIYTFSGFALYAGVRHPYFLNALIIMPLMFLAVDKLLKEKKFAFFSFMTAVSAITNYYFFYMITIISVLYAFIKYLSEYRENGIKGFLEVLYKAIIGYIIGVLISGVILFPTIYGFLNSNRSVDSR